MPAAKIEKSASGEMTNGKGKIASSTNNGNNAVNMFQDPQKIANSIIEKKIRNLEKRKARLLELKAMEDKGQQLEAEQKIAVKKLDNVVEMIDMLKEIGKNVTDGLNEHAKQLKKQQKKEQLEKQVERQQQDLDRVKLWLNSQLITKYLPLESVKNDLLQGKVGESKLESNQVDALDKLVELLSPSFDSIESSVEKVTNLLEGNKREFITGVSFCDLKELLVQLIDSKYFENVASPKESVIVPSELTEDVKSPVEEMVPPSEPVQDDSQVKSEEHVEVKQTVQNVHHLNNQLCFMRDPVVENELQHKDPAVVAVASLGFPYPPQNGQALSTSSGSNMQSSTISAHYPPHIYPTVSIPTQTFTNPSYTTILHPPYIPVISPSHPHPIMPEQSIPNVAPEDAALQNNVKVSSEKPEPFSPENSQKETSQDADSKPLANGQFDNRGSFQKGRPRGRGGYRGDNFGNHSGTYHNRGGRGGNGGGNKGTFGGYYNNNGNAPNPNFNPNNNRPVNRQNGGGSRPYRQERGVRNQNQFSEQVAPVSTK